jgi:hypothetical protein
MKISDDLLAAYIDGELDDAEQQRIERAIEEDPMLARRVTQQRALRERLRGAFDEVLREPVPQRLVQAARLVAPPGTANVISLASARAQRAHRADSERSWLYSRRIAIAASLLVGVGAGLLIQRLASNGSLTELRPGTLLAHDGLAGALNHQLASEPHDGPVSIGVTFRGKDGALCRTFSIKASQPLAGLACREQQQWQLLTLVQTSASAAASAPTLRPANSPLPPALLQAVMERISGDPFDAPAESKARDSGWR